MLKMFLSFLEMNLKGTMQQFLIDVNYDSKSFLNFRKLWAFAPLNRFFINI